MNVDLDFVMNLSGMRAMFIRGFLEYFDEQLQTKGKKTVFLRECQDAGKALVEEQGGDISVPYISKLSRYLVDAEIVTRSKQGRKFICGKGKNCDEMLELLDGLYGTRLKGDFEDDALRTMYLNYVERHGSIRSTPEGRIPTSVYKMFMKMVRDGELDLVVMKPKIKGGVKYNGKTEIIDVWHEDCENAHG
jgi:hypothetical protein